MYCSTCGAFVPAGRSACSECGTQLALPVSRPASPASRFGSEDRRWIVDSPVGVCPRCSYQGEGIGYFSRGRHVAFLVGATLFTAGMMGVGGLAYYLVRRDHRVCPRCGKGWGRYGEFSLVPARGVAAHPRVPSPISGREGRRQQVGSVLLFVLAAIMMIGGIAGMEVGLVMSALLAATAGWFLRRSAIEARAARRAALLTSLQQPVLKLAAERQGRLTVTEVAAQMGWSLPRAEKVLESLNDGLRVDSEVTDEGVIVYEFRELRGPPRLPEPPSPGPSGRGAAA